MRKLSKLQESIWSDIQDRSSGEAARKEDDINFLDRDGLYDYICANYEILKSRLAGIINSKTFNTLIVPVLMLEHSHTPGQIFFNFQFNKIRVMYFFPYSVEGLFDKLVDNFQLKREGTGEDICYVISPKDESKVTNKFFINLIDFIIENIPDKLKVIKKATVNESLWADIQDRSSGETIRKEDDHKFRIPFEEIKKIPDSELFEIKDKHTHLLWTPYNFGAKSESEPGLYLDGDEIFELAEYLDGTEYHMATQSDWVDLNYLTKYHYDYTKINGYWTYVFTSKDDENKKLYVPNFGYISSWFANHPEVPITPNGINKSDHTHYGWVFWGVPGRTELNNDHYFMKTKIYHYALSYHKGSQTSDRPTDRLQIRLVKTPGKTWKFNKS